MRGEYALATDLAACQRVHRRRRIAAAAAPVLVMPSGFWRMHERVLEASSGDRFDRASARLAPVFFFFFFFLPGAR